MEEKINILWLDDDFDERSTSSLLESVKSREKDFEQCKIQKASNKTVFKGFFDNDVWDAVILDIYGLCDSEQQEPNWDAFFEALRVVENKCQVVIAYSGEIREPKRAGDRLPLEKLARYYGVEVVHKSGDPKEIIEKVLTRIKSPFRTYFPESKFIEKNLDGKSKEDFLSIENSYNENSKKLERWQKEDFDNFRVFAEDIFKDDALARGILNEKEVEEKCKNKSRGAMLGDYLRELADIAINEPYKKPYVRAALLSLNNLINVDSHSDPNGEAYNYGKYRFHAFFNALFISLKWYYEELIPNHKDNSTKDIALDIQEGIAKVIAPNMQEGIVEKDEEGNIHLGNVLLPHNEKYVNKKVRLRDIEDNTKANKHKYPLFAWFDPVDV